MEGVVLLALALLASFSAWFALSVAAGSGARLARPALRGAGGLLERAAAPLGTGRALSLAAQVGAAALQGREGKDGALGASEAAGAVVLSISTGATAGGLVSGSLIGAVLGGGAVLAWLVSRSRGNRLDRRSRIERALPDAFGALAVALGSGYSLARAMRYVGARVEDPVGAEFTRVGYEIDLGAAPAEALDGMLERLPAPGLDLVAIALKVSRGSGAAPGGLLADAARFVGERIELARELDVKTAQARMSARVVALMPVIMMGFLLSFSPDYRRGAASAAGVASIVAALVLDAVAWYAIGRVMRVEL